MADLLPALSSDEEHEQFDDEDDEDEEQDMDIVFGGLLVSLYRHLIFCESEVWMNPIKFANFRF
jgi:hypothetical protein